jgi:hypothetical protein
VNAPRVAGTEQHRVRLQPLTHRALVGQLERAQVRRERLVGAHGRVQRSRPDLERRDALARAAGQRHGAVGEADGLVGRRAPARGLAGLDERGDRLGANRVAGRRGALEVVREQRDELVAAVADERLEPFAGARVRAAQLRLGDRAVRDLADQRMAEGQLGLAR